MVNKKTKNRNITFRQSIKYLISGTVFSLLGAVLGTLFVDSNINITFVLLFAAVAILCFISSYRIVVGSFGETSLKTLILKILPLYCLVGFIIGFLIYR
ncbi:hypothetical protein [Amphibacillus sediminis]|uniref:hypothetical protein n=1 Tax=Amphibacillus sediminis TaxID=360185 RepID=UPI00082C6F66|nr:hypothetical protein [Amphibacillus sediminis]